MASSSFTTQHLLYVELHAHINGSISNATMQKLVELKSKQEPDWKKYHDWQFVLNLEQQRTMEDAFKVFKLIHQLCDTEEAAYMVTHDVISEFENENVKYLELRTTPRNVQSTNMTKRTYIESVLDAIKDRMTRARCGVVVRLLLAVDRRTTLEDAWDTLHLAQELNACEQYRGLIVGLDLSGDPSKGDARIFIPVFKAAKEKGFKLALHLSEIPGQNAETEAMLQLPPDRIGHGTFLDPDSGGSHELVQRIQAANIPIEFCLTSNIVTATAKSAEDHHFGYWYNRKHPCLICTDDKGVFATSLTKELELATAGFKLTKDDLWDITIQSIDCIFASIEVKSKLKSGFNRLREST